MGLLIISYDIISSDFESPLNKIQKYDAAKIQLFYI